MDICVSNGALWVLEEIKGLIWQLGEREWGREGRRREWGEGGWVVVVGGKREGVDGGSGKERDRWLAEVE